MEWCDVWLADSALAKRPGTGWLVVVSTTLGEKGSHLQPEMYQGIIALSFLR